MTLKKKRPAIVVGSLSPRGIAGTLVFGNLCFPCALGRAGRRVGKREGDGATPVGVFALRQAFYRADRMPRPKTALPLKPLRPADGWCDAAGDRNYNRPVRHPYPASAEHLWRTDGAYDVVIVLGYNDTPRVQGRGSAVFLHIASDDLAPTAGCVALKSCDLKKLLVHLGPRAAIRILA